MDTSKNAFLLEWQLFYPIVCIQKTGKTPSITATRQRELGRVSIRETVEQCDKSL